MKCEYSKRECFYTPVATAFSCYLCAVHDAYKQGTNRPSGEWLDEGRYAESAGQHVYICTHCKEHIVEYPSEMGSYCKYCGSDNRSKEGEME